MFDNQLHILCEAEYQISQLVLSNFTFWRNKGKRSVAKLNWNDNEIII